MATIQTARLELHQDTVTVQTSRIELVNTPPPNVRVQTARIELTYIKPPAEYLAVGGQWLPVNDSQIAVGGLWR